MRRLLDAVKNRLHMLVCGGRQYAPVFVFALLVLSGVFLFGSDLAQAAGPDAGSASTNSWAPTIGAIITTLFGWLQWLLGLAFTAAIEIVSQAMQFGNFINAKPVVAGWIVVRDFTNLLFIIVLLVISFGIIFGQEKYGRIEMIPQLFIMAIAINFSRTIVGFLTDISQVFMMTFVRAFQDAAAGNFVELFSVDVSKSLNTGDFAAVADSVGALTIASIVSTIMLLIATVIMGYLAVIMVIRVVVIWILIVLAPLAWFMKLIESWGDHSYQEWWKELKAQLTLGPIMAFFMWLALATASGASADFVNYTGPDGERPNKDFIVGFVDSASVQNIIKAIIATAILLKGLEVAQHVGGKGSSLLGKAGAISNQLVRGRFGALKEVGAVQYTGRALNATRRVAATTTRTVAGGIQLAAGARLPTIAAGAAKVAGTASFTGAAGKWVGGKLERGAAAVSRVPGMSALGTAAALGAAGITKASKDMGDEVEGGYKSQAEAVLKQSKDAAILQFNSLAAKAQQKDGSFDFKSLSLRDQQMAKAYQGSFDKETIGKMNSEQFGNYVSFAKNIAGTNKTDDKKREAMHHIAEQVAENMHRLPSDVNPATGKSRQQEELEHMRDTEPGMLSRVDARTFVAKDDSDKARAATMQNAVGADNIARIIRSDKNADAVPGIARAMDAKIAGEVAGNLKADQVSPALLRALEPEQVVNFVQNMNVEQRNELVNTPEKARILDEKRKAFRSSNSQAAQNSAPTVAHASAGTTIANLAFHVAAAKATPGGANAVDTRATLGYANQPGAKFEGQARQNFERLMERSKESAQWLLNSNRNALDGEPGEAFVEKASVGTFTEIAKLIEKGEVNDQQRAMVMAMINKLNTSNTQEARDLMSALRDNLLVKQQIALPKPGAPVPPTPPPGGPPTP